MSTELLADSCPITMEPMRHPVVCPEGHMFEAAAIRKWLTYNPRSPITRTPLFAHQLVSVAAPKARPVRRSKKRALSPERQDVELDADYALALQLSIEH